jgi:hypothetical protein
MTGMITCRPVIIIADACAHAVARHDDAAANDFADDVASVNAIDAYSTRRDDDVSTYPCRRRLKKCSPC